MSKGEFLGRGVVAVVGVGVFTGHQLQGLFLAEYDEGTDSYTGISFPQNEEFTQFLKSTGKGGFGPGSVVNAGVAIRIPGLRRYPYEERPDYAFQFVLPGEDSAFLRDIMEANAAKFSGTSQEVVEEATDPADLNNDGVVTKAERKQHNKEHPEG